MSAVDTHPEESVFRLLKAVKEDLTDLIKQEIALAKREFTAKAKGVGRSAALFAGAAGIIVYAVFFLCLFLNNLIQTGLAGLGLTAAKSAWLAPLSVGLLLAIGGALLALSALKSLRRANPVSAESLRTLRKG